MKGIRREKLKMSKMSEVSKFFSLYFFLFILSLSNTNFFCFSSVEKIDKKKFI